MEIKDVQLHILPEVKEGEMLDGLAIPSRPEIISFLVDVEGEAADVMVPNEPTNAHYWQVKEWYDAQESKPFDFKFEEMPEPVFEETIYPEPEESEETDQEAEQLELPVAPEEPETLLPR